MGKLSKGEKVNLLALTDIYGKPVVIPDEKHFIHLQFRRFAGCPICDVHIGRLVARKGELDKNNIKEIIVFYSEDQKILDNLSDIPFTLIGDPQKKLYRHFGVESSPLSVLNPLVWPAALVGFVRKLTRIMHFLPRKGESVFGLPADFLITADGVICDLHYGSHAYDQWDFETLIGKVAGQPSVMSSAGVQDANV